MMRFLILAAIAASLLPFSSAIALPEQKAPLPYIVLADQKSIQRTSLPNAVFQEPSGARIQLQSLKGYVVILSFWTKTCGECIRQMPSLDRLQGAFRNKKLLVIAAMVDQGGGKEAQKFFARNRYSFLRPYADPNAAAARRLGVSDVPTTILIDRMGREIGRATEYQLWDTAKMIEWLNYLLYEPL